jgi:hypothetical protein
VTLAHYSLFKFQFAFEFILHLLDTAGVLVQQSVRVSYVIRGRHVALA